MISPSTPGCGRPRAAEPSAPASGAARTSRPAPRRKLDLLMALVALALAWAGRAAAILLGHGAPRRKVHGYFARS